MIIGFAEDNNVVFLWTIQGVFMIHLESLQFMELPRGNLDFCNHPFESVYAAGKSMSLQISNKINYPFTLEGIRAKLFFIFDLWNATHILSCYATNCK
jgi:hypothetical protein